MKKRLSSISATTTTATTTTTTAATTATTSATTGAAAATKNQLGPILVVGNISTSGFGSKWPKFSSWV